MSRGMVALMVCAALIGISTAAQDRPATWGYSSPFDASPELHHPWISSFEDDSNCGNTSDLLWIELAFHFNERGNLRNQVLEGWWGLGEKDSSCSPIPLA